MNTLSAARPAKYSAPAVKCAAEILKLLAASGRQLATSEIARETASSRSLVFRVLHELEAAELVRRHGDHEFWLGMQVLELGGAYASQWDFSQTVRQTMAELATDIGETVNFAVLDGAEIVYLLKQEGRYSVTTISVVGTRLPANCTSLGKAMLSTLPEEDLENRLQPPLPASTPRSISKMADLRRALGEIRQRGYATEEGESVTGRCCVAVPIRPPGPAAGICALSVSMSQERYQAESDQIADRLVAAGGVLGREARARERLDGSSHSSTP